MRNIIKIWLVLVFGMMLTASCSKSDGEDPTSLIITADVTAFEDFGGSLPVSIQADKDCAISSSASWLTTSLSKWTVATKGSRTTVQVYAERNNESSARQATITITSGNTTRSVTFEQAEKATVIVEQAVVETSENGGDVDVKIKANIDCEYKMLSGSDWLIPANTKTPVAERVYKFRANENTEAVARKAEILFFHGDFQDTVTVRQSACPVLNVTIDKTEAAAYGEKIAVKIVTNMNFELDAPEWITLDLGKDVDPSKLFEEGENLGSSIELEGFLVVESSTSHSDRSAEVSLKSLSREGISSAASVISQGGVGNSFGFTTNANSVTAPVVEGESVSGYIMWGDDSTPVDYSTSAKYTYPRSEQGKEHEVRAVVSGGKKVTLNTLEGVSAIDVRMF